AAGTDAPLDPAAVERALVFVGLVGLRDPPRREVPAALARCRTAGIRVLMLTGDHPLAALAIGRELGLVGDGGRVLTGDDLDRMTGDELSGALAGDVVFARVRPEQKLRITATLQARGEVVAVTGDGTNDAPALHGADVGVAMGRSGTDLAREAADVILLDDNFASIVAAIEEGRTVYANIKRFTSYIFTSNAPEAAPFLVFALSGGRVPLALGVMPILAIDLGTDMAPALALGAEPPDAAVMQRPPRRTGDPIVTRGLLARAYLRLGLPQAVAVMLAFLLYLRWGGRPLAAGALDGDPSYRGGVACALAAVVVTQIGNLFAHRRRGGARNPLVVPALVVELGLLAAFIYLPPFQRILGLQPFAPWVWLPLVALVPLLPAADRLLGGAHRVRR
ncbi:MAG TPA: HAD-IC family P-type ATPase, partial [Kofleriaceae bacterium]|nr:HAD-IC family P-type ATPase [Kofleriaceae bacterium]